MSNCLDPDQDPHSVGPDLGPICLQRLSAGKELNLMGLSREKTCLRGFANNTGAGQPEHPRSLISAFVICFLESIISRLVTSEISIF